MFKGEYKIIKKDVETDNVTYESDWIPNVVTTLATEHWDKMPWWGYGTGNGAATLSNKPITDISTNYGGYPVTGGVTGVQFYQGFLGTGNLVVGPAAPEHKANRSYIRNARTGGSVNGAYPHDQYLNGDGINVPYTLEFSAEWSPPGSDTDVAVVGISRNSSSYITSFVPITPVVVQTTTETLIVFYKLTIALPPEKSRMGRHMEHLRLYYRIGTAPSTIPSILNNHTFAPLHASDYSIPYKRESSELNLQDAGYDREGWWIYDGNQSYRSYSIVDRNNSEYGVNSAYHYGDYTDTDIGRIRSTISMNKTTGNYSSIWKKFFKDDEILPGNFHAQLSNSTTPFFFSGEIALSNGGASNDITAWTDSDWPNYLRYDFTNTGGLGVGEYAFRRRKITGFNGNTYTPRDILIPIQQTWQQGYSPFSAISGRDSDWAGPLMGITGDNGSSFIGHEVPTAYNKRSIILAENSAMVVYDMLGPDTFVLSKRKLPTFTPTSIGQFVYDKKTDTIWITCADTGIWSIQYPTGCNGVVKTTVVTNHDISGVTDVAGPVTNKAYAICLGLDLGAHHTIWAVVDGALVKSVDNGATWTAYDSTSVGGVTFTHTEIEADWSRVMSMKADKKHVDERLLIIHHNDAVINDTLQTYATWWDKINDADPLVQKVGSGVTDATGFYIHSDVNGVFANAAPWLPEARRFIQHWFDCSPKQSQWAIGAARHAATGNYRKPMRLSYGFTMDSAAETWDSDGLGLSFLNSSSNYNNTANSINSWDYDNILHFTTDDLGSDCLIVQDPSYEWFKLPLVGGLTGSMTKLQDDTVSRWILPETGIALNIDATYGFYAKHLGEIENGWDSSANLDSFLWDRYVWSGSDWTLRDSDGIAYTTKPMHAGMEPLVDGINISWDDNSGTQQWRDGEFYTQTMVNGVHMDGATSYTWTSGPYMCNRPTVLGITDVTSTVPAATLPPWPVRTDIGETNLGVLSAPSSSDLSTSLVDETVKCNHTIAYVGHNPNTSKYSNVLVGGSSYTGPAYMDTSTWVSLNPNPNDSASTGGIDGIQRWISWVQPGTNWSSTIRKYAVSKITSVRGRNHTKSEGDFIARYQPSEYTPWNYWTSTTDYRHQSLTFGVSSTGRFVDASLDSAAVLDSDMAFGFYISTPEQADERVSSATYNVSIMERGNIVYTLPTPVDVTNLTVMSNRTERLAFGDAMGNNWAAAYTANHGLNTGVNYSVRRTGSTVTYYQDEDLIYTSLAGTDSDMVFMTKLDIGVTQDGTTAPYPPTSPTATLIDWKSSWVDNWAIIGNQGANTGAYDSDFKTLICERPNQYSVALDGTPLTDHKFRSLPDSDGTDLVPGQVSIYTRDGLLRFSNADVGKAITVDIGYSKNVN